ncbi:unnamed protein product, partial [Owenia fusiformis]
MQRGAQYDSGDDARSEEAIQVDIEEGSVLQVEDNTEQIAEHSSKKRPNDEESSNDEEDVTSSKKLADVDPYQLIMFYMDRKHTTYVRAFLSTEPTVDFTSLGGQRCILKAIKNDEQELLELFFKHTQNAINMTFDRSVTSYNTDFTTLMYTAKYNSVECLRLLIESGIDVNVQNNNGDNALIVAAAAAASASRYSYGVECLKLLIESGI